MVHDVQHALDGCSRCDFLRAARAKYVAEHHSVGLNVLEDMDSQQDCATVPLSQLHAGCS